MRGYREGRGAKTGGEVGRQAIKPVLIQYGKAPDSLSIPIRIMTHYGTKGREPISAARAEKQEMARLRAADSQE
jgi:hypothetical protein